MTEEANPDDPSPPSATPARSDRRARIERFLRDHAGLVAFFGGFVYDSITLRRIDKVLDNVLLALYLAALGVLLIFERRLAWSRPVPNLVRRYPRALELGTQFLFGGLFSAYIVFYFKSAGGLQSLLFMVVLTGLMFANEFRDGALRRLETLRVGLYFFTAFSFFLFAIPVFTGFLHPLMWLPAAAGAGVLSFGVVLAVHAGGRSNLPSFLGGTTLKERLILHGGTMAGMVAVLATLSGFGLIPPVPISVTDRAVAHSVERKGDGYHLMVDTGSWRRSALLRPTLVRWAEGEGVVVFTSIFAPKKSKLEVAHRWQQEGPDGDWRDTEPKPIRVTVMGSRSEGYRTYARKRAVSPGKWRVIVETEDERAIGTVRFDVVQVEPDRITLREIVK